MARTPHCCQGRENFPLRLIPDCHCESRLDEHHSRLPAPAAGSVQARADHSRRSYVCEYQFRIDHEPEIGEWAYGDRSDAGSGTASNLLVGNAGSCTPVVPREVRFLSDAKTLVSVSEAQMRVAVLADITVVQGEPSQFHVELPAGYEVTGVTGATLDSTEIISEF